MSSLPHSLDRSLLICAPRDVVFGFFTDSARFASWWGAGSTVDPKVGGEVRIIYPGNTIARGTVQTLEQDRLFAFTYGYEDESKQIPVGSTLVTIELEDHEEGTRLTLRHDLSTEKDRNDHIPGWRFQLSQFANVVAKDAHQRANEHADQWFSAWHEKDAAVRLTMLESCTSDDVRLQDQYACLQGRVELNEHITMCQMHMQSAAMQRTEDVKQCQGTGLVAWQATDADGKVTASGSNVTRFAPDGRICSVVGLW